MTQTEAKRIPLALPTLGEEEIQEVADCLRSGWITTGPRTRRFEEEFAQLCGADHALAVTSCTAALHLAYVALDLQKGDEVILPPLTWPATASMVVAAGGVPVFADIERGTWNLDPEGVLRVLTPRTRAVVPVHFAGLPVDLDALAAALASVGRPDVKIIEDAAHAAGATYKGHPIGRSGGPSHAACFSFHPVKNLTTAEGGMLVTGDAELAKRVRLWRFHGVARDAFSAYSGEKPPPDSYDVVLPGFKYNFTDLQAAIGLVQLRKLDTMNARRRELLACYREALAGIGGLELQAVPAYDHLHAGHLQVVLVPSPAGDVAAGAAARVRMSRGLNERGIGTGRQFEAVHTTSYFRKTFGTGPGQCPVAEEVCARIVSLPLYPRLEDEDVDRVAAAIREVLGE